MSQTEVLAVRCSSGCKRELEAATVAELQDLIQAESWEMLQIAPNKLRCPHCRRELVAAREVRGVPQPPTPPNPQLFKAAVLNVIKIAGSQEPVTNSDVQKWGKE